MRLCLRSQDLHRFTVAIVNHEGQIVHESCHPDTRPEDFFRLLIADLHSWDVGLDALQSIAVVTGPGSYTSLRTLTTLANTLAFALRIPVAGMKALENSQDGEIFVRMVRLKSSAGWVTPAYAHPPNITKSRK